ncbi:hypothetical protein BC826DRAFT_397690 [Russula brevipes]|nr:hypothetical protein BC826DRAFT_397690 [Russula brevipes]
MSRCVFLRVRGLWRSLLCVVGHTPAMHGSADALSDQSETFWHGADLNCGLRAPPQETLQVSIGSTRLSERCPDGAEASIRFAMFGAVFERPRFATAVVVCTKFYLRYHAHQTRCAWLVMSCPSGG